MSQRDNDHGPGSGRPLTTGEFRAAPDLSANTAEFRAFASQGAAEGEAPWEMKAPVRNVGRLALIVVLVAVVLAIIAVFVLKI
jgi:hypothetical protein